MHINWFPGHMKKTIDMIKNELDIVNVVVEVLDARIPKSSRNPLLEEIIGTKPLIFILNKIDLVEKRDIENFKNKINKDISVIELNAKDKNYTSKLLENIKNIVNYKNSLNILIAGIPNSGKSTIINALADKKVAKVENRAGVTRGKQIIRISKDCCLIDTPGVLWHKFDTITGIKLVAAGSIKDDSIDIELVFMYLAWFLYENYKICLENYYKTPFDFDNYKKNENYELNIVKNPDQEDFDYQKAYFVLETIAKKRGNTKKGGILDIERTGKVLLNDFRKGILGKISLESPTDCSDNIV